MNWMFYLKTTETCNLNCRHCFTNGINGAKVYWDHNKVIDWIHRFSKQASDTDTVHCEFHGGEPFLVPPSQMYEVWDKCKESFANATWGATTNLVFKLYQEHIDLIKGPFEGKIGTSWDPKIRFDNKKQVDLWRSNIKTLLNEGIVIRLFISVTKDTIAIDPIVLLRWIRKLGVQEVSFERLTVNGNAKKFPEIFPSNTEQDAWFLKMHEQSVQYGTRGWFDNDFLEIVYSKFETGFNKGGTFCRDCEQKIFTLNADGTISGCPNSAPEFQFGNIEDSIEDLINRPIRLENIACEASRNHICYSCDVFQHCGGDCHQLAWQGDICGAPKSLMRELAKTHRKVFSILQV
jgi:radical SAM protein with 4Fe4S-binding SPASM domain